MQRATAGTAAGLLRQQACGFEYRDSAIIIGQIFLRDALHVGGSNLLDRRQVLIDHFVVAEQLINPKLHRLVENRILPVHELRLFLVLGLLYFVFGWWLFTQLPDLTI